MAVNIDDDPDAHALLRVVAQMPFLDMTEAATIAGIPRTTTHDRLLRLTHCGLIVGLHHSLPSQPATTRYTLTEHGLSALGRRLQSTPEGLARSWPVSAQWTRLLLRRLDAIAVVYRVVAATASIPECHPLDFIIRRTGPLDAVVVLPERQRLGFLKQGGAWSRRSFTRRLHTAMYGDRLDFDALLLIVPNEAEVRNALARLSTIDSARRAYVATEMDLAMGYRDLPCWRRPHMVRWPLTLPQMIPDVLQMVGYTPPEKSLGRRATILSDTRARDMYTDSPALNLQASDKRILDLIADWPLITRAALATMAGVTPSRISQVSQSLSHVINKIHVGDRKVRYALNNAGVSFLARRDRLDTSQALKHWSPDEDPDRGGAYRGSKLRELMRALAHTDAVHEFNAMLVSAVIESATLRLEYVQPPHKSVRSYTYEGRQGSLHPDAAGLLTWGNIRLPFMLELERRARDADHSAARAGPYKRYFSRDDPRPTDEWSTPLVLVVFEDPIHESQFVTVVSRAIEQSGDPLPIVTTHLALLRERGPLGPSWITPQDYLYQRKSLTDHRLRRVALGADLLDRLPDPASYLVVPNPVRGMVPAHSPKSA